MARWVKPAGYTKGCDTTFLAMWLTEGQQLLESVHSAHTVVALSRERCSVAISATSSASQGSDCLAVNNMEQLREILQDCNLNFLVGSGLSSPFLSPLGKIEFLLTELAKRDDVAPKTAQLVRLSLYKKYFDSVIAGNIQVLRGHNDAREVADSYSRFLRTLNAILLKRKSTILSKQINIFTTNVDIFLEKALESLALEVNDGFSGRFDPKFSLGNFKKAHFQTSSHYDNTSELPVFNLLKLHGSLSWALSGSEVVFSRDLANVLHLSALTIPAGHVIAVPSDATLDSLVDAAAGKSVDDSGRAFLDAYENLLIVVNPNKDKFRHTVMNQTYYELLRLYSNELEKENTLLCVMGFSFADEHICDITVRAANSNPTLIIYVIAHTNEAAAEIRARLSGCHNNNVRIVAPPQLEEGGDEWKYDFGAINERVFEKVLADVQGPGPSTVAL